MVQADRASDPPVSGRIPTERGWSLNFLSKGSVAAGVATLVALMALGPAVALAGYDPEADTNSMYWTTQYIGATDWWGAGYTGAGVDVAVIDTGVSPVEGLATEGKIVYGPDLSLESQDPNLRNLDTNGHGTFMAGLIAGHDSALTQPYASAPSSAYRGVAPDARIVSLKVGVADGGVDVSQVIAAIDWVVQHKTDRDLNIRVINLSYGTNSTQHEALDPLSYAAEQAWKAGIVVVAAAGNTGYQLGAGARGLADPAYNPWVIAAGGYDTMGTAQTSDDVIGQYSASAARCFIISCRHPSFVAVGSLLQGLRVPGGYVDQNHGQGQLGGRYIRGSGTSEAAAITSGSVALLLQKYPQMPPDQVKKFLTNNATNPGQWPLAVAGAGELNLAGMLSQDPPTNFEQRVLVGLGWGSLERSRGTDHLTLDGVTLAGEQDIFGNAFRSWVMARLEAAGNSWSGGTWNGSSWTGSSWTGNSWTGSSWTGSSWSGNSWTGSSWTGNSWTGSSWTGNSWTGSSWSGNSWTGNSWSGENWN